MGLGKEITGSDTDGAAGDALWEDGMKENDTGDVAEGDTLGAPETGLGVVDEDATMSDDGKGLAALPICVGAALLKENEGVTVAFGELEVLAEELGLLLDFGDQNVLVWDGCSVAKVSSISAPDVGKPIDTEVDGIAISSSSEMVGDTVG